MVTLIITLVTKSHDPSSRVQRVEKCPGLLGAVVEACVPVSPITTAITKTVPPRRGRGQEEEEEEACQDYYSHCDDHGGGGSETDGYLLLLVLFKACGVQSCHNNLK